MSVVELQSPTEAQNFSQVGQSPSAEVEAASGEAQQIVDRFADIQSTVQALPVEPDRVSDTSINVLNRTKWDAEKIVDELLPQTHQFTSARRGVEVNVEQTKAIFGEVEALRAAVDEKTPKSTADSMFQLVDQSLVNNTIKLLEDSKRSSIGDRRKEVYGLDDTVVMTAQYLCKTGNLVGSSSLIKSIVESGRGDILLLPAIEELSDTSTWRQATIFGSLRPAVAKVTENRGRLSVEQKAPSVREYVRFGFTEAEAKDILGASLAKRPKDSTPDQRGFAVAEDVLKTLEALDKLREIDPELPKKAYEVFGIRNFSRYSAEDIARQTDPDYMPDTVALSAVADWNGAFDNWGEKAGKFSSKPMYIEANDTVEILQRFRVLRAASIPVKRVVVAAHGTQESMTWGRHKDQKTPKELVTEDEGLKKLVERKLIEPGCEVILFSCNTGHDDGIGDEIAKLPGIRSVQAPDFIPKGVFVNDSGAVEYGTDEGERVPGKIHSYSS